MTQRNFKKALFWKHESWFSSVVSKPEIVVKWGCLFQIEIEYYITQILHNSRNCKNSNSVLQPLRKMLSHVYLYLMQHTLYKSCTIYSCRLNQGPLITDGRKSNKMIIFPINLWKFYLGISKPIKISLQNLNDMDFRS